MVLGMLAAAGVSVTPVEARVTGGSSPLTELHATRTIALRPVRTELPEGIVAIPVPDVQLPLLLVWPAGRPSPAVDLLRESMAAPSTANPDGAPGGRAVIVGAVIRSARSCDGEPGRWHEGPDVGLSR
jgi:hypothetical protein